MQIKLLFFTLNITFSKNPFFPSTVVEWNKLDPNLRSAAVLSVFKKNFVKFTRPSPNSVFNCRNCKGIKYPTRIRLGLSHLREHKFKNTFQDTPNPFCSCWNKYILLCSNKYTYFFFTYPCLLIKGAPSWAQLMNDSGSSLIWYWLIFFFLVKLFSANRCQENLFKYFVVFYYIFISLTFFVYPYVFFFCCCCCFLRQYIIHVHLVLRFVFIYLLALIF